MERKFAHVLIAAVFLSVIIFSAQYAEGAGVSSFQARPASQVRALSAVWVQCLPNTASPPGILLRVTKTYTVQNFDARGRSMGITYESQYPVQIVKANTCEGSGIKKYSCTTTNKNIAFASTSAPLADADYTLSFLEGASSDMFTSTTTACPGGTVCNARTSTCTAPPADSTPRNDTTTVHAAGIPAPQPPLQSIFRISYFTCNQTGSALQFTSGEKYLTKESRYTNVVDANMFSWTREIKNICRNVREVAGDVRCIKSFSTSPRPLPFNVDERIKFVERDIATPLNTPVTVCPVGTSCAAGKCV